MMLTRLLRSVTMTARRQVPSMAATEDPNAPIELDFNPYEKPKSKCVLCRTETRLDYKNSRLLQQFVSTFSGRVYEQHVTGLCDSQYKHLLETIRLSRRAGYMPVMTKDAKYLRDARAMLTKTLARGTRVKQVLHGLLKEYPEQFLFYWTFGLAGMCMFAYNVYILPADTKPWYRGRYDIVRPNSAVAMSRREPELYPAYYVSNRQTESYSRYSKDYGWKANLDKA